MAEETDLFIPKMPEVQRLPDPAAVFAKARVQIANPSKVQGLQPNQRCLGIVTPGRMVMIVPSPKPDTIAPQHCLPLRRLAGTDQPLNVVAIGFNDLKALMANQVKAIPLLPTLLGLAYLGHSVFVFEGHSSVLEHALAKCDLLLIDSAMLPLLDSDWAIRAWAAMNPGARIVVHQRKSNALLHAKRSTNSAGWQYADLDGEVSYVNCLLTTLAKRSPLGVELVASRAVPHLGELTTDPRQLEWISGLPFRYDSLSAEKVIEFTLQLAKLSRANEAAHTILRAKVPIENRSVEVSFHLRWTRDPEGLERLSIEKMP